MGAVNSEPLWRNTARGLRDILELSGTLEVADIGAAYIAEEPPYKALVDLDLAHLNAFEADPRHHAKLREVYTDRVRLFPHIVGDGRPATLHIAAAESGMTSLLTPSAARLAFFNGFPRFGAIQQTAAVETMRLDDVSGLPDLDFLKMDIQGSELQVLRHGAQRLARCAMVQLEVSFVPLYEDQPCFGDIDVLMRERGFIPHCFTQLKRWSIAPVVRNNDIRQPFNQLLEADIVYMADPLGPAGDDPDRLKAMALLAHACFRSVDLVGHLLARLVDLSAVAPDASSRYAALLGGQASA